MAFTPIENKNINNPVRVRESEGDELSLTDLANDGFEICTSTVLKKDGVMYMYVRDEYGDPSWLPLSIY